MAPANEDSVIKPTFALPEPKLLWGPALIASFRWLPWPRSDWGLHFPTVLKKFASSPSIIRLFLIFIHLYNTLFFFSTRVYLFRSACSSSCSLLSPIISIITFKMLASRFARAVRDCAPSATTPCSKLKTRDARPRLFCFHRAPANCFT